MSKKRVKGHKDNSILNKEWASHVKKDSKQQTAGIRRMRDKKIIHEETKFKEEEPFADYFEDYHNPGYDI